MFGGTLTNLHKALGYVPHDPRELEFYDLAIMVSGAVQAARWTPTASGSGFIHSFNGPHSLFSDTIRSVRILCLAHRLGHMLMGEGDKPISLLGRAVEHVQTTSRFNVYFGQGRDTWDVPGRVVHESIFNTKDGNYRCPSTQQGYSAFSTWTRGLAWILCGYAEQLEFFRTVKPVELEPLGVGKRAFVAMMEKAARATADFHIENSFADGVPFWDTGAPAWLPSAATPAIPRIRTMTWSPSTHRRRRSAPRACCASETTCRRRVTRNQGSATATPP